MPQCLRPRQRAYTAMLGPMSDAPTFTFEADPEMGDGADAAHTLRLHGTWRLEHLAQIEQKLKAATWPTVAAVDASELKQMDSACAMVLLRTLSRRLPDTPVATDLQWTGLDGPSERILNQVRAHLADPQVAGSRRRLRWLARLGKQISEAGDLMLGHLNFLGQTVAGATDLLRGRRGLRMREFSAQIQKTGLDAIPVVALVTGLIGVVFTYLLGLQASRYGANIFVVDGVAIGTTREFAPIIVAIVVAGRSGAAFTAQLGSMRLTEEIDAIQTLGLSPQQVLVLPRVLALMLTLPLLVFVGDVAAIAGSIAIAGPMLDITATAYLERLHTALELKHVVIGLAKAPVFALVIAIIGTRMGMTVGRDTSAVGAATTSTVVQSIVAVILLDAVFAIVLQALGW